jgi:hypothetical protein
MKAAATRGSGITLDRGEELDVTCSFGVPAGHGGRWRGADRFVSWRASLPRRQGAARGHRVELVHRAGCRPVAAEGDIHRQMIRSAHLIRSDVHGRPHVLAVRLVPGAPLQDEPAGPARHDRRSIRSALRREDESSRDSDVARTRSRIPPCRAVRPGMPAPRSPAAPTGFANGSASRWNSSPTPSARGPRVSSG